MCLFAIDKAFTGVFECDKWAFHFLSLQSKDVVSFGSGYLSKFYKNFRQQSDKNRDLHRFLNNLYCIAG